MNKTKDYKPILENLEKLKDLTRQKIKHLNNYIAYFEFKKRIQDILNNPKRDTRIKILHCVMYQGKCPIFNEMLFFTDRDKNLVDAFLYEQSSYVKIEGKLVSVGKFKNRKILSTEIKDMDIKGIKVKI